MHQAYQMHGRYMHMAWQGNVRGPVHSVANLCESSLHWSWAPVYLAGPWLQACGACNERVLAVNV